MLRIAFIALVAVVGLLIALSLLPQRTRTVPDSNILLEDAEVTLYPQADPEAVWTFQAPDVTYVPEQRETTLYDLRDGERRVDGELDFTLASDEVTIDASDNLRGELIEVHLLEANWDLTMQAKDDFNVLIDQQEGKFIVPVLDYTGDGLGDNHAEGVSMNFDLTDFQSDCRAAVCQNQVVDEVEEE